MREKVQLLLSVVSLFPKCPFHGFPSRARARGASETLNDPSQAAVTRWGWCAVNGKLDFSLWSAIKAEPEGVLEKLANKYGGLGVKRAQTIYVFFFARETRNKRIGEKRLLAVQGKKTNRQRFGFKYREEAAAFRQC